MCIRDCWTPSMGIEDQEITGENAAEFGFIYESYNDGEGTNVQFFKTGAGELGTYIGKISNPGNNPAIGYTVEFYLEHAAYLSSELDGYDIPLGSTPMLTTQIEQAELVPDGVEITQSARLFYPDGSLALIELNDEGGGADAVAGDGIYSSALPESTQPGYYSSRSRPAAPMGRPSSGPTPCSSWCAPTSPPWAMTTAPEPTMSRWRETAAVQATAP